jgi:hypothetical protein
MFGLLLCGSRVLVRGGACESCRRGVGLGRGLGSGVSMDDEAMNPPPSSSSSRDGDVMDAVMGDVEVGLKYDGSGDAKDAEVDPEMGGGERAETMEWETSERRIDARFWFLEKLG